MGNLHRAHCLGKHMELRNCNVFREIRKIKIVLKGMSGIKRTVINKGGKLGRG